MRNRTNSLVSDLRPKPLSHDAVWDRLDPLAADAGAQPAETGLANLPYYTLHGPGFERLIYELLQTENQRPWFFGRNGQAQYGVDIVTEATGRQTIYQCKNYAQAPDFPKVRDAVAKFESEWLGDMNLPTPEAFVYCCPHPFDDSSFDMKWQMFKDAFEKRTGVSLSFLDQHELDSKLRHLPDIVAGLFSDSYAEHFCGQDDWRDDPWVRVQRGPARFLGINRFIERHDRSAIYVADSQEQLFLAALDQGSTVALRGLPGVGKSFLALELACRLRQPMRRIYYATLKDGVSAERLWQSARRRTSLPSLFVLDDCHLGPEAVENLQERLDPELRSGRLNLVMNLRDQVGHATDQLDDSAVWLAQLKEGRAIIDLRGDSARTLAVACQIRPSFVGLSRPRLERLHNACGGDLFLLDEILRTLPSPQDIDTLGVGGVLASVRSNYFGGNHGLPTIMKLAALAQFDLVPRANFFEEQWQVGERELADPLMTQLFGPERYQFLHSSLAALVLRALAQLAAGDEALDDVVSSNTMRAVRDYLLHLIAASDSSGDFRLALQQFLSGRLDLWGDASEARMRSAVLSDNAVKAAIEKNLAQWSFASLGLCVRWLSAANHAAKGHYVEFIERRFRILFEQTVFGDDTVGMNTMNSGLVVLFHNAPDRWTAVLNEHGANSFLHLISAKGTVFELFRVLQYATSEFRTALLAQLNAQQVEALIDKTIASGRSIGTLDLAMRELGKTDLDLLVRLENAIGAPGFLRLILANGTVFELFMVLKYATSPFRTAVLEQLTVEQAEALIEKTIASGRSIGTLSFAMRELGQTDLDLLVRLENTIGAPGFLRLILANGTVVVLFMVLKHATSAFRTAVLEQLTVEQAEALIEKTIASERSIGTLSFAMRELGETDLDLLARLENAIGAPGFLRLILANGTVVELFGVLEYATSEFRTALLAQLNPQQVEALIDKTIASGRSIGTLDLAMFDLGETDLDLLIRLENAVGAPEFLRLILTNGTVFELFMVLKYATSAFRTAVLEQLTVEQAEALIEKTIASERSIGTLHLAMRELGQTDRDLLARLENAIGAPGFLRLILANGTVVELFKVLEYATFAFRTRLLEQLTAEQAKMLIGKTVVEGRRIESLHFTLRMLASTAEQLRMLQNLIEVEGWWKLLIGCGSLNSVSQITMAMRSSFRERMMAAATEISESEWSGIIARGLFLNTCAFVTNDLPSYPEIAGDMFRAALIAAAPSLAARASWFDLNPSRPLVNIENAEGNILRDALRSRMEELQLTELFELDFREAVNALACCWHERADLRSELGKNLHRILSSNGSWPREKGQVAGIRLVLTLARSAEFPLEQARWLLAETTDFLDTDVCEGTHTFPLFLLVWNLAALSYERGPARSFAGTFSHTTQELLLSVVEDRVQPKGPNPEKLAQFELAGMIAFLFPQHKRRLVESLRPLKGAVRWLAALALEQSFVPAVFALEGIALVVGWQRVFTLAVCDELLPKFQDYEDVGPALEQLRLRVSRTREGRPFLDDRQTKLNGQPQNH